MVTRSRFAILAGITLFSGLIAAPALADSKSTPARSVQHLTCVQDSQGLMCTIDEASTASTPVQATTTTASEVVSAQQLGQLSDLLLGLIYLGFPVGVVLAVLLRDKHDKAFAARVEQLERVWNQPPQS